MKASRHRNMRSFDRGRVAGRSCGVLFAFDPERKAILLVAGNKAGRWKQWYKDNIPIADDRFDAHLAGLDGRSTG